MFCWFKRVIHVTCFLLICTCIQSKTSDVPNILFVLVDDLGWNDVSYHGGSDFETPNIDKLAVDALELTNYYVQHYCTPTRSALMSGRYPMRDGLQQYVIRSMAACGMPLDVQTIPEHLKTAGYTTHLIGKWHLGFFDPSYTPTKRGFDSFVGYYGDKETYYYKNISEFEQGDNTKGAVGGYDFRRNMEPWLTEEYSTFIYGNETLRIMQEHVDAEEADPFFILLSSQAAHKPYDAPQQYLDQYDNLNDTDRQEMAAVLAVFDDTLGDIIDYLQSEQSGYLWDDTMVIFSTDNGGYNADGHSNFPLRGGKKTLWEGGIRATGFITGGWLPDERRGMEMNALMHVTDWLPTLVNIAGFEMDETEAIDGYDQSSNIRDGVENTYWPREEILHNILPQGLAADNSVSSCYSQFCGAIRYREYKLIIGVDKIMNATATHQCDNRWCDQNIVLDDTTETVISHSVQCSESGNYQYPNISSTDCVFNGNACLFNVAEDPCEWNDLSTNESFSDILKQLMGKLGEYNISQMYPLFRGHVENGTESNPDNFGGFWSPWKNIDALSTNASSSTSSGWSNHWTLIIVIVASICAFIIVIAGFVHCLRRRRLSVSGYKPINDVTVSTIQPSSSVQ